MKTLDKIKHVRWQEIYVNLWLDYQDYKLLRKLGFDFERNINCYLHEIAEEIRRCSKNVK